MALPLRKERLFCGFPYEQQSSLILLHTFCDKKGSYSVVNRKRLFDIYLCGGDYILICSLKIACACKKLVRLKTSWINEEFPPTEKSGMGSQLCSQHLVEVPTPVMSICISFHTAGFLVHA